MNTTLLGLDIFSLDLNKNKIFKAKVAV